MYHSIPNPREKKVQMMFAMDDVGFLTQGAVSVGIIFFMAVIGYQILKRKDLF